MAFPDLTQAEEQLCKKLADGFPGMKVQPIPGDLLKFVKTKLKTTKGIALVQYTSAKRVKIDEAREGWELSFEVTILNKQLTAKGHQGAYGYVEQSINAIHRDEIMISGVDYTFFVDRSGFTGVVDKLWEYAFNVRFVPSLTI